MLSPDLSLFSIVPEKWAFRPDSKSALTRKADRDQLRRDTTGSDSGFLCSSQLRINNC